MGALTKLDKSNNFDVEQLLTIEDFARAIKQIKALEPLIKLLDDAQARKEQLFWVEIEIARKAVAMFPDDLTKIYRNRKRVVAAEFWASKTDSEILDILSGRNGIDFFLTYNSFVRDKNEKAVYTQIKQRYKSYYDKYFAGESAVEDELDEIIELPCEDYSIAEAELLEQRAIEEIARFRIYEKIKEERIDEIENKLDKELRELEQQMEEKARAEREAVSLLIKHKMPSNVKEVKEELIKRADEIFARYSDVDVDKVLMDVAHLLRLDGEVCGLFRYYLTSHIRDNYDVCRGRGASNQTVYYKWDYATRVQRANDVHDKIEGVLNDLKKLSKRMDVTDYIRLDYGSSCDIKCRDALKQIIKYIQEEEHE